MLFGACLLALLGHDASWPEYRGPHQNGDAGPGPSPLHWSESENLRWKLALPGKAWSTPVIVDGRAWLTSATEDGRRLSVLVVDLERGELLREIEVFENEEPVHVNALNSHASPSPVTDGERLYAHYGVYGTAALELASGKLLWQRRDLPCEHLEGPGSSPVLVGDSLVFHMDGAEEQYVIALAAATGETRWRVARDYDYSEVPSDMRKAFSTPLRLRSGGEELLVCSGAEGTFAYDPRDGAEVWRFLHRGFSMSARPISDGERVFLNTGFMKPTLLAVRLGGQGDVSASHLAWSTNRNVPTMTSPLLLDGRLYLVDEGGIASCLVAASGELLWRERLGGEYSASPLRAGERIYCFDREGEAVVLRAGPAFEVLARNRLDEGCMASPVAWGERLVVRTRSHLYCIEERPAPPGEPDRDQRSPRRP